MLSGSTYSAVGDRYHEVTGGFNIFWSNIAPLTSGETRGALGWGGGVGYAYYINQKMSLRTGLEVNFYRGTSLLSTIADSSTVAIPDSWDWQKRWDDDDDVKDADEFTFNYHVAGYSVQHSALYFHIPLLFGYEDKLPWMDWLTWYAHGGFKLGYSIFGNSNAQMDSVKMFGSFPYYGYQIPSDDDPLPGLADLMGFRTYPGYRQQTSLKLGFSSTFYLEVGVKQKLAQQYSLYVGIFGEYSLYSATVGSSQENMFRYEPLPGWDDNLYKIHYTPASQLPKYRSRTLYPMSFGMTVRFSFDTKRQAPSNSRMLRMRYLDL